MLRVSRSVVGIAAAVLVPAVALAQATPAPSSQGPSAALSDAAATDAATVDANQSTTGGWSAPAPAVRSSAPTRSSAPADRTRSRAGSGRGKRLPDAIMPGFETLADGSTQLFIELSQPVTFQTKVAPRVNTYVLKGAHVERSNNYNPLVTVNFNTPVTSARLVPHGKDLWFVVAMRADVQPTATMDAADGATLLHIHFPKGDYLPPEKASSDNASPEPLPATTTR